MTGRGTATASAFRAGHARAARWQDAIRQALAGAGDPPPGANLGFLYVSDRLGESAGAMLERLRDETGVEEWVGSVGVGVIGSGVEYFESRRSR